MDNDDYEQQQGLEARRRQEEDAQRQAGFGPGFPEAGSVNLVAQAGGVALIGGHACVTP